MTTATTTQKTSILRLIVLFVVMFASTSAFAQDTTNTVAPITSSTVASSSTDFAVWFIGNAKQATTKTSTATSEKKQLINAGFTTTNVLIKKVVKKIMSQENAVA
jgi:hypothetical protein